MGKTRRSLSRKPLPKISAQTLFVIKLFIQVWEHLHKLHHDREKFALFWMWKRDDVFHIFVTQVLGLPILKWSKGLLYNGYNRCRSLRFDAFQPHIWEIIDSVFAMKSTVTDLPNLVVSFIDLFSSLPLHELCKLQQKQLTTIATCTHFSREEQTVQLIDPALVDETMDCFLGPWTEAILQKIDPSIVSLCRCYPTSFVTLDSTKNYTAFYDRQGGGSKLIAMILRQQVLTLDNVALIRSNFKDLFAAHKAIERNSCASLDSELNGFGPFWHSHISGGGMKVSFYTHAKKLSQVLKNCTSVHQFAMIADRYAHEHVTTIILALFMWWMPEALSSFFAYSAPFMQDTEYDLCDSERTLGGRGPTAYQMYITKDYCSEMHKDRDHSEYTLCYASHPDCGGETDGATHGTPIQFTFADYGFTMPVHDRNLYMFRSAVSHGTRYRVPSMRSAYVGCLIVNSALQSLMHRRKLRNQKS